MKRLTAILLGVALLAAPVFGQGGADGYSRMSVEAGLMKGNFNTGRQESLTGNVHIVLLSDDATKPSLPIRADTITFEYTGDSTMPAKIKMAGNVDIQHPQGQVKAQRADWDLETGDLIFTGNPVMDSENFKNLAAERIRINMKTGAYEVEQGSAASIPIQGNAGGGGDTPLPGELSDGDVTDFAGLIEAIKAQAKESGDNPGKQILGQLDPKVRALVEGQETAAIVGAQGDLLKQLNKVIRKPGMYKKSAWEGITLSDEVKALLSKPDQTPEEQARQNRLLLQAAYPGMVKPL